MFSIVDLTIEFRGKTLFRGVNLEMKRGARYGLVGANGSGKTTFFRMLSGDLEATRGSAILPSRCRLGILKQDAMQYEPIPIRDVVMMGNRTLWDAHVAKEEILAREELTMAEAEELAELEVVIAREGGYEAESRITQFLEGLGIPEEKQGKPLKILSSGYRLRVLLAQLLFDKPDVLLLDEPTNYLDIVSISWLERYLKSYEGTCILSSHDRTFLNKIATDIIDVDYETLKIYPGDFDHFWEKKLEQVALRSSRTETLDKKQKELQRFIDRFRAKASKARQASSKEHLVRKLEAEKENLSMAPSSRQYPSFGFIPARRSGAIPLAVKGISKSFGAKCVLSDVSFEIGQGEKVAIVGPNGVGKSTLLEIIAGNLDADSGEIKFGHHAYPTYFPQNIERFMPPKETVLQWLVTQDTPASQTECRAALGRMLFTQDDAEKQIGTISGGERARLYFAKMMLTKANIITLDEPTNHLDMESTETLADALKNYDGTVITVSHNRHFICEVATRILEISHRGIFDFQGTYEEYAKRREKDPLTPEIDRKKRVKRKREKSPLPKIEEKCQKLEVELESVTERAANPDMFLPENAQKYKAIIAQKNKIEQELMTLYIEWEKLSDNK
jgi:ATPase subunit of ABC transporter with duplicated ATPase domains